jgi:hypothetical protein
MRKTHSNKPKFNPSSIDIPRYDEVYGLPPNAMVFSQSERKESWCNKKWWFRYANLLGDKVHIMHPFVFGSCFHSVMEDIHTFWMITDGAAYSKDRLYRFDGPINAITDELFESYGRTPEAEEIIGRVKVACEGYLSRWGLQPPERYRIIGVEEQFCFPVMADHGRPYRSMQYLYEEEDHWRLAVGGDDPERVNRHYMPWYHIGKADFIAQDKKSGDLYIGEMKTSGNPVSFIKNLELDSQIHAYTKCLEFAVKKGWLKENKFAEDKEDARVSGYIYDIAYSGKQVSPKVLKSGKLSKDSRARVTSWSFIRAMEKLELEREEYEEHISSLEYRVDRAFYLKEWGFTDVYGINSFTNEVHTVARKLSELRKNAYYCSDAEMVDRHFIRTHLCRARMYCPYTSQCSTDYSSMDVSGFTITDQPRWLKNKERK